MCYTIKEKSYLRAEANAKSKILATLVYDTELEILEDIPRWYKVKYIDETGVETEGWISKISIER
nr:SH3 domain-containing protein [Anaerotignum lactatifermentans]